MFTVFLFILYTITKYIFLYIITLEIVFFNYSLLYLVSFFLTFIFIIINIKLLLNSQYNIIVLILYKIFNCKRF